MEVVFVPKYSDNNSNLSWHLEEIDRIRFRIERILIMPKHEQWLRREAFIRTAYSSTMIENATILEQEMEEAAKLAPAANIPKDHPDIANYANALEFVDRPVNEVLTPRTDITWAEKGITVKEFLDIYREDPHSRYPVYDGTIDNVVGVLNIKDLLMAQASNGLKLEDSIDNLIRPAYFTPETKHLGDLLSEMRDDNYGMVIVVDEYGGVAGVVTQRQLTGEIVGSLGDELADAEQDIVTINANTFEIDSGLRIDDANEELQLGLPTGGYETIAGFVLSHLGRIPKQNEQLRYKNITFHILEMRGLRIEKIRVIKEIDAASPA